MQEYVTEGKRNVLQKFQKPSCAKCQILCVYVLFKQFFCPKDVVAQNSRENYTLGVRFDRFLMPEAKYIWSDTD